MTTVNVSNTSDFPREEYVIWGSPVGPLTPHTYSTRAGGHLNVGLVDVPPKYEGAVEVLPYDNEPFTLHEAVYRGVTEGGLHFVIQVNDATYELVPVEFPTVHPLMLVTVWRARTPHGICEMVTYTFHKQPVIRFELTFFCESLEESDKAIKLVVAAQTTERHLFWVYGVTQNADQANDPQLLFQRFLGDAQGVPFTGFLAFYTPEMFSNPSHPDTKTILANCEHPLFAVQRWENWGPWQRATPINAPLPVPSHTEFNPFAYLGYINSKEPRSSGEQAEFGAWHHVSTVSTGNARGMWSEYQAARREACRPIYYFEPDGTPVQSVNHPDWTTWDEQTHFHRGVSTDRLYRTHNGSRPADLWYGHDRQHQGWQFTGEAVLLTGSVALERLIRMQIQNQLAGETIPSMKPGWSTNDPDSGRAVGRTWIMVEHWRRALPPYDRRALPPYDSDIEGLVDRMFDRWVECVEPRWRRQHQAGDVLKPYQITTNPNNGALIGNCWNVWEDGIWVTGLCALGLSLRAVDRPADARRVENVAIECAEIIVRNAWTPDYRQSCAYVRLSDRAVILDTGTEFARWLLMAVGVLARNTIEPELMRAIAAIRAIHEPLARDTYTGTLP